MKINKTLLPVKAHFFFFMAASGPILPFLTVYGKQLGISEVVMGSITAILPLIFLLAKPAFGFLVDYFYNQRKILFMILILCMSLFYVLLYFVPPTYHTKENISFSVDEDCSIYFCIDSEIEESRYCQNKNIQNGVCTLTCSEQQIKNISALFTQNTTSQICLYPTSFKKITRDPQTNISDLCEIFRMNECEMSCSTRDKEDCIYFTITFYGFVVLMCLGMISYNVANSITDAICCDMLGSGNEKNYGKQRVWGAVGFGITALLGGFSMDLWSKDGVKDYKPAFIMVMIFTLIDMYCCSKLKLPALNQSVNILKDLGSVIRHKNVMIFLIFATFAGILDSFIIYFMFWFLEDIARENDSMSSIKLLEGLTVAAETLGGEVIFFTASGKILEIIGHGHSFTLCFLNYTIRLFLISLVTNPWWILAIEFFMQGPTYALCYSTIVAYAGAISPPGTSATMQGLVAGMDDGFGYAIGSLIGGFLYEAVGGEMAFKLFALIAFLCCIAHCFIYKLYLSKYAEEVQHKEGGVIYRPPKEAVEIS